MMLVPAGVQAMLRQVERTGAMQAAAHSARLTQQAPAPSAGSHALVRACSGGCSPAEIRACAADVSDLVTMRAHELLPVPVDTAGLWKCVPRFLVEGRRQRTATVAGIPGRRLQWSVLAFFRIYLLMTQ